MNTTEFGENRDNDDYEDMNEKIKKYRSIIRNRRNEYKHNSEDLPSLDMAESLTNYCIDHGKFEEADDFCKLWAEYFPYSVEAWQKYSYIKLNLNEFSNALKAVEKALMNNYQIKIVKANVDVSQMQNTLSNAGMIPTFALNATNAANLSDNTNNPASFFPGKVFSDIINRCLIHKPVFKPKFIINMIIKHLRYIVYDI